MVLTDEEIDTLLPKITLKGMDPKQQVWLTKKDAIAFVRAAEIAIIAKLAQGVDMPEAVNNDLADDISAIDAMYRGDPTYEHDAHYMRKAAEKCVRKGYALYTADQLRTAIAAARVKALEDAALNCEELHWTWRMGDNSGPKECAEKIRALKGTP